MILCLLSCVYQTCDRIDVYHVYIIFYPYLFSYHIISLSYHLHQTDSEKFKAEIQNNFYIENITFETFNTLNAQFSRNIFYI